MTIREVTAITPRPEADGEPNDAEAHYIAGLALQHLGKWQEALSHHEKALLLKPDMAEAHASLGNVGAGRFVDLLVGPLRRLAQPSRDLV